MVSQNRLPGFFRFRSSKVLSRSRTGYKQQFRHEKLPFTTKITLKCKTSSVCIIGSLAKQKFLFWRIIPLLNLCLLFLFASLFLLLSIGLSDTLSQFPKLSYSWNVSLRLRKGDDWHFRLMWNGLFSIRIKNLLTLLKYLLCERFG